MYYILLIISCTWGGNNLHQDLSTLPRKQTFSQSFNIPSSIQLVGLMVQFPKEIPNNPKTSGNGQFLSDDNIENYINFFNSDSSRCKGFLVDSPPHNTSYFFKQLESVSNYYKNVSNNSILFNNPIIIENSDPTSKGYYELSNEMEYYAKGDDLLVELFSEAINLAKFDIESYFTSSNSLDDIVFIIFHAGLSQDFSYPSFDPTIYDLKSAYIDTAMMENAIIGGVEPAIINDKSIYTGIILPETYNIIYYDVVEDIYGNPESDINSLCEYQYGMTGIFAFLLGYELGLPPLFNTNTGEAGIGIFGLMDYGSNNGRGVIPAPPNPWTRAKAGWSNIETISSNGIIPIESYNLSNKIYKIEISETEYFLIENRNNWLAAEVDIDSLRIKHQIDQFTKGNWFDVITETNEVLLMNDLMTIDESTGVITEFVNYDYGLPGSGILIWHIKEPELNSYLSGINNKKNDKHIQIEEADGSLDIGHKNYFPSWYFDATSGTKWDMWFANNEAYLDYGNPFSTSVVFNKNSNPNSRSINGAESFISISVVSNISETMYLDIDINHDIESVNISDESIIYLGNMIHELQPTIFYAYGGNVYKFSTDLIEIPIDIYDPNKFIYSNNGTYKYILENEYINPINGNVEAKIYPHGYIESIVDSIPVENALSLGDIDLDGLDEIITISTITSELMVHNHNGSIVNGFPVKGEFSGIPLIANILDIQDNTPEIICRELDNIVILSNSGDRLREFSSVDPSAPLALIPFWNNKMALIDGSRLLLFDLELNYSYWLNSYSRPSGFPVSTGLHNMYSSQNNQKQSAYNYPNPITSGNTTFRFYINTNVNKVSINIYDVAGYIVEDGLELFNPIINEYNEISWNNIDVDAGYYLAEVIFDGLSSEIVRVVFIK